MHDWLDLKPWRVSRPLVFVQDGFADIEALLSTVPERIRHVLRLAEARSLHEPNYGGMR
jgi:hypothetical protein